MRELVRIEPLSAPIAEIKKAAERSTVPDGPRKLDATDCWLFLFNLQKSAFVSLSLSSDRSDLVLDFLYDRTGVMLVS